MTDVSGSDHHARLAALVRQAAGRASASSRAVLVSVVERVPAMDPLDALYAAAGTAPDRMYWSRPSERFAIAAFGAAATIAPAGSRRFAEADRAWRELLHGAVVDDAGHGTAATGPLLAGGFSFEPEGPRSALWGEFGSAHLVVPTLLLTVDHDAAWLTSSVVIEPGMPMDHAMAEAVALRDIVLSTRSSERHSAPRDDDATPVAVEDLRPNAGWRTLVRDAVERIRQGELRKVVLARAVRAQLQEPVDVIALLDFLRTEHRDSYVFACWRGSRTFVGASPERLVRLVGRDVDASSLAGSASRGATPAEDAALATALAGSAKDRAEHAMVRAFLGEALGRFCDQVRSSETPSLLTLPHVHHLHTAVHARLRAGHSILDLAGALHPTPAVGGTPRDAALAFIREQEHLDRGWYAAPVGWIGRDGGELAVALRSAVLGDHDATMFAGCGIVAGSDPVRELAESEVKLRAMRQAIGWVSRAGSRAGAGMAGPAA